MIYEKIQLTKDSYLEVYAADKTDGFVRKAILVIPGGGYGVVCSNREGEPIAMAFLPHGYNAFVLHYSVRESKNVFPTQLTEASMAMKYIKDNAEKYNIDADKVFAVGFSAGGHLTACLGTMWDKKEIYDKIDMEYGYNKPTGVMLIYPVVSAKYHIDSFYNLLDNDNPSEEMLEECNVENFVNKNSAPAYIVHTSNDQCVDVRNSLVLAEAYKKADLMFELHIYPDAPHGMALGNAITAEGVPKYNNPVLAKWVENAAIWAEWVIKTGTDKQ